MLFTVKYAYASLISIYRINIFHFYPIPNGLITRVSKGGTKLTITSILLRRAFDYVSLLFRISNDLRIETSSIVRSDEWSCVADSLESLRRI